MDEDKPICRLGFNPASGGWSSATPAAVGALHSARPNRSLCVVHVAPTAQGWSRRRNQALLTAGPRRHRCPLRQSRFVGLHSPRRSTSGCWRPAGVQRTGAGMAVLQDQTLALLLRS